MRNMKDIIWKALCLIAVLMSMAGIASAQVPISPPDTISYQGFLTNTSGTPINTSVSMNVGLYTAATGGTAIFTETHGSVGVTKGQFNIQLGSVGTGWSAVNFAQPLWVAITVGGESMSPRVPLSAVAYARYAFLVADGTITAASLSGSPGNGTDGQFLASDGTGGFKWTAGDNLGNHIATQPFRLAIYGSQPYPCDSAHSGELVATSDSDICFCRGDGWESIGGAPCSWDSSAD